MARAERPRAVRLRPVSRRSGLLAWSGCSPTPTARSWSRPRSSSQVILIRMAVGSKPRQIVALAVRDVTVLVSLALALGLATALAANHLLAHHLYGISLAIPSPPRCCCSPSWVPARRATRVDPLVALRCGRASSRGCIRWSGARKRPAAATSRSPLMRDLVSSSAARIIFTSTARPPWTSAHGPSRTYCSAIGATRASAARRHPESRRPWATHPRCRDLPPCGVSP